MLEGSIAVTGALIQWLRDRLKIIASYAVGVNQIERAAAVFGSAEELPHAITAEVVALMPVVMEGSATATRIAAVRSSATALRWDRRFSISMPQPATATG